MLLSLLLVYFLLFFALRFLLFVISRVSVLYLVDRRANSNTKATLRCIALTEGLLCVVIEFFKIHARWFVGNSLQELLLTVESTIIVAISYV